MIFRKILTRIDLVGINGRSELGTSGRNEKVYIVTYSKFRKGSKLFLPFYPRRENIWQSRSELSRRAIKTKYILLTLDSLTLAQRAVTGQSISVCVRGKSLWCSDSKIYEYDRGC